MRARLFTALIALWLAPALIIGGLACGSKKANPVSSGGGGGGPGPGPGDPAPFGDGTWELRYTITASGGDASCAGGNGSFVDTFTVASGEVSGFIGATCTFSVNGSNFSQTCRDTVSYASICRAVVVITGTGQMSGDTFTASYTATLSQLGACTFPIPGCTFTVTATGTRIGPIAGAARVPSVSAGIARAVADRAGGARRR